MKVIPILFLLLLTSAAFGELTKADLHDLKEDIRSIVKEEVTASEKRTREYINLKIDGVEKGLNARIDGVEGKLSARIDGLEKSLNARINETNARIDGLDKRMNDMWRLMMGLFGLVAATIAVPQIIIAFRNKDQKELENGRRICKPKSNNSANRSKRCRNEA